MRSPLISFLFLLIICLANCSKPTDTNTTGPVTIKKPDAFKVTVTYRTENEAALEWTEATGSPTDTIRYSVYLNSIKVDSNLTVLTDTLKKLAVDSIYKGLVIATNKKGDTTAAAFQLQAFSGTLYIYDIYQSDLNCYDLATGQYKLAIPGLPMEAAIPLARNKDTIFCSTHNPNPSWICLAAYNIKTGAAIWKDTVLRPLPLSNITYSSCLTYENGKLALVGENDIYVFSSTDGTFKLRANIDAGYGFQTQPVMVGGIIYVGGYNGTMHALDATTGKTLWVYKGNEAIWQSQPCVANGKVYAGTDKGTILALDALTGARLWSYTSSGYPVLGSPRVEGTTLYISIGGYVHSFDALTGKLNWKTGLGGEVNSTALDHNGVFVVSNEGGPVSPTVYVIALNKGTGAVRWKKLTHAYQPEPIAANNRVYVYGQEYVYIYNASTGDLVKSLRNNNYQVVYTLSVDVLGDIYYPAISPIVQ